MHMYVENGELHLILIMMCGGAELEFVDLLKPSRTVHTQILVSSPSEKLS